MSTVASLPSAYSFLPEISAQALIDKKSAVLKHITQSERLAAVRPASRLEVRPRPEMISTGIPELDALTGGLPRGCFTEICGSASSGKTSLLVAMLAAATQRGESCVVIDASDSFDPGSGAAAGVEFGKLLWVRCGKTSSALGHRSSEKPSQVAGRTSLAKSKSPPSGKNAEGWGNRDLNVLADDQRPTVNDGLFAYDARRTTYDGFPHDARRRTHDASQSRLEQVLKATDLVLHSGGFGLVALDLAGIPEKFVRRIPLASWFRFVRAIEHTKTVLLAISEVPCAQTCAALVMNVLAKPPAISRQPSGNPSHAQVLPEMQIEAEIVRSRLEHNQPRKPMHSANTAFKAQSVRAG